MKMPRWSCERCGGGDNATRYHCPWAVCVSGEQGVADMPEWGEEGDHLDHHIELCDRCALKPDTTSWLLAYALRVQLASRCPDLTEEEALMYKALAPHPFGRSGALP
jgi:hypothetical protein